MSPTSEDHRNPATQVNADEQFQELSRGVVDLVTKDDLLSRLSTGEPLRIKAGFDPTRPDLHLGHTVLLNKMRQFQRFGHRVVFLVGDFTARIGDPTGRNVTRQVPTEEQIREGARTYAEQAFKVLDPDFTHIEYNGSWLKPMGFDDVIRLAGKYTLARMMERDDFKRRWTQHQSISLHELLYPLAQAQDSVALKADVELGGTDQLFNLLVGRDIMRECGLRPQVVMTTPILEGFNARMEDGQVVGDKMSKSLDNYVGVNEHPKEQFGKIMSLADGVMWRYFELLSSRSGKELRELRQSCEEGGTNPRDVKAQLAHELVRRFHGVEAAEAAERGWFEQFSNRQVPEDMPVVTITADRSRNIVKVLVQAKLASSNSDARRRISQGAVHIDGARVTDPETSLDAGSEHVVKAGKRAWAKVVCDTKGP